MALTDRCRNPVYVNEGFRLPSSGQAATRTSFSSLIGRRSQTAHSGDLVYVFTTSVFSSNLLFHFVVRDFMQDMEYVML